MDKRGLLIIFIFVVIFSFVYTASAKIIVVNNLQEIYHLGDGIKANALIESSEERYVIVGSSLLCGNFSIDFFKSAQNLLAGKNISLNLPNVPINKRMIGECSIMVSIEDFEGRVIEKEKGGNFTVTDKLELNVSLDKKEYMPGEFAVISGNLNISNNYNLSIFVNGEKIVNRNFNGREFVEKLETNKSYKGILDVGVVLIDQNGNTGEVKETITIITIPTSLEIETMNNSILPGGFVVIKGSLYDQANDFLSGNIEGSIIGQDNNVINQFNFSSGSRYVFSTEKTSPAGKYTVDVRSGELRSYSNFIVREVMGAEMSIIDNKLRVTNIGNVMYAQRGFVKASAGGVVYQIPVSFDLGIEDSTEIDLSSELSGQFYNISIGGMNKTFTFNDSYIEDNRTLSKKVSQGVSRITGNAVIETDDQKNFFFVLLVVLFLAGSLIYVVNNKLKLRTIGVFRDKVSVQDVHIGELNKDLIEEKQKSTKIRELFAQYVDTDVLEQHEDTQRRGTEKREITAMFTDIRGFSSLFGKMDDVEITELLNPYFKRSQEIVARYGGMVNKFIGDSVMALFNAPRVQQDHLMRTVKAALDIQREIEKLNVQLRMKGVGQIKVGIGIDTGSAAVGHLGGQGKIEYTAIGVPVNMAARLQATAAGGQILVRKEVYEKIKDRVNAESLGKKQFKNMQGDFEVYSIKGLK